MVSTYKQLKHVYWEMGVKVFAPVIMLATKFAMWYLLSPGQIFHPLQDQLSKAKRFQLQTRPMT